MRNIYQTASNKLSINRCWKMIFKNHITLDVYNSSCFFIPHPVLYFFERNTLQNKLQLLPVQQPATRNIYRRRDLIGSFFQALVIKRKTVTFEVKQLDLIAAAVEEYKKCLRLQHAGSSETRPCHWGCQNLFAYPYNPDTNNIAGWLRDAAWGAKK